MEVFETIAGLRGRLKSVQRGSIGFVPTMGALHQGHLTLVAESKKHGGCTVVSIFVNPTQFNNPDDLKRYPRDTAGDLEKLRSAGCDIVFIPPVEEIYPDSVRQVYPLGTLETLMEGRFRPGHFQGVAMVVHRLFDIVKPDRAFFGEKDFQQLAIIRKLTADLALPIEIVPVATQREPDGLAMSSRNLLLTPDHRAIAPLLYRTLSRAKEMVSLSSPEEIRLWVAAELGKEPLLELEYFEIADATTLQPVEAWNAHQQVVACIAAWAGKVRLIDNLKFYS